MPGFDLIFWASNLCQDNNFPEFKMLAMNSIIFATL